MSAEMGAGHLRCGNGVIGQQSDRSMRLRILEQTNLSAPGGPGRMFPCMYGYPIPRVSGIGWTQYIMTLTFVDASAK